MSSGKVSGSRNMDSKTRAKLEEIALAEADVARLKQKVAELHQQLHQQRQHHYVASDPYQHNSQQNTFLFLDYEPVETERPGGVTCILQDCTGTNTWETCCTPCYYGLKRQSIRTFVEVENFRRAKPDAIAHSAAKIISRLKSG